MEVVQILKDARALIADEKNWTQGAYARAPGFTSISPTNPKACIFCSVGAVARAAGIGATFAEDHAAVKALDALTDMGIVVYNDEHSHEDVLTLFDLAIARAESEVA